MNTMVSPIVSLVVPVYNSEKYLAQCLKSIISQTYKKIDIILVDDGSRDKSGKICDEWKEKDSRIRVVHQQNKGVSAARNVGMSLALGDLIAFCDSDDRLKPRFVEVMQEEWVKNQADFIICDYAFCNARGTKLENRKYRTSTLAKKDFFNGVLEKGYIDGYVWNKVFSAKIIKDNNLRFDENISIYEDLKFVCEYALMARKIRYISDSLYKYYQLENSAISSRNSKKYVTALIVCDDLIEFYTQNVPECMKGIKLFYIKSVCGIYFALGKNRVMIKKNMDQAREYYKDIKDVLSRKEKIQLWIDLHFPMLYGYFRAFYIHFWRWNV